MRRLEETFFEHFLVLMRLLSLSLFFAPECQTPIWQCFKVTFAEQTKGSHLEVCEINCFHKIDAEINI